MALRKIVTFPDPRLREKTQPVLQFNAEIHQLIDDMFETMYHARGVGLAGPQIGIPKRIAVIDVEGTRKNQYVLINPEIIESGPTEAMQEGCLSVPGHYDTVKRASWVKMRAFGRDGKPYELEATGVLAEAIQHEIDHLNGTLYIDQLSSVKRQRIRKKLTKRK